MATWTLTLVALTAKSSGILLAATMAAWLLRRAPASHRHRIWTGALAATLLLPALERVVPIRWAAPVPIVIDGASGAPVMPTGTPRTVTASQATPAAGPAQTSDPLYGREAPMPAPAPRRVSGWLPIAGGAVWLAGLLAVLLRLVIGTLRAAWVARRASPLAGGAWEALADDLAARLGIARAVALLESPRSMMPMAWGLLRPVVMLPHDASSWPADRRRAVLLHEFAHLKRRDCLVQAMAQLACAWQWFNPLAWLAARRVRVERERACDDLVIAAGTSRADYADHLLAIARSARADHYPAYAGVAMARLSDLEGRLLAILDPQPRREMGRLASILPATTLALLVVPVAAVQPAIITADSPRPAWVAPVAEAIARIDGSAQDGKPQQAPATPSPKPSPTSTAGDVGIPGPKLAVGAAISRALADPIAQAIRDGVQDALRERPRQVPSGESKPADPRVVDALLGALTDSDADVRVQALAALSQIGDSRIIEPVTRLLKDPSADVRRQALFALSQVGDSRAIPAFIAALGDEHADVRKSAAFALGVLGDAAAIDPLIRALKDPDADVRKAAAFALSQLH
jgi:beta-lactamase regulating signal transducer with metallopeptidase domain